MSLADASDAFARAPVRLMSPRLFSKGKLPPPLATSVARRVTECPKM